MKKCLQWAIVKGLTNLIGKELLQLYMQRTNTIEKLNRTSTILNK